MLLTCNMLYYCIVHAYRHQHLQFKDPEKLQTEEQHQVAKQRNSQG